MRRSQVRSGAWRESGRRTDATTEMPQCAILSWLVNGVTLWRFILADSATLTTSENRPIILLPLSWLSDIFFPAYRSSRTGWQNIAVNVPP
jgi:hypothetical protein